MSGIFWGGILLSAFPIMLGIGIGVYVLYRYWTGRADRPPGPAGD